MEPVLSSPDASWTNIQSIKSQNPTRIKMRVAVAGDPGVAGDTPGFAELIDLREEYRGKTVEIKQVEVSQLEKLLQGLDPGCSVANGPSVR